MTGTHGLSMLLSGTASTSAFCAGNGTGAVRSGSLDCDVARLTPPHLRHPRPTMCLFRRNVEILVMLWSFWDSQENTFLLSCPTVLFSCIYFIAFSYSSCESNLFIFCSDPANFAVVSRVTSL